MKKSGSISKRELLLVIQELHLDENTSSIKTWLESLGDTTISFPEFVDAYTNIFGEKLHDTKPLTKKRIGDKVIHVTTRRRTDEEYEETQRMLDQGNKKNTPDEQERRNLFGDRENKIPNSELLKFLDTRTLSKLKHEFDRVDIYKVGEITAAQAVEGYRRAGKKPQASKCSSFNILLLI